MKAAADPVAAALAFAIRRAVQRREAEEAARRRTLSAVPKDAKEAA